jgi:hypothetical protein
VASDAWASVRECHPSARLRFQLVASWRKAWNAWDKNPVSVRNRRFLYRVFGPLSLIGLIVMLTIGEWVAAGFMAIFIAICLESGLRTEGTLARRVLLRLRLRSGSL